MHRLMLESTMQNTLKKGRFVVSLGEKNPFSEQWEDSDLILLVEDEKFHVHHQILSVHSPVFKAMLNSQFNSFKEGTATEIPARKES